MLFRARAVCFRARYAEPRVSAVGWHKIARLAGSKSLLAAYTLIIVITSTMIIVIVISIIVTVLALL